METPAHRRHTMNVTLLKALVALVPACMLFSGSVVLFFRGKTECSFLQLLGGGCLKMSPKYFTCFLGCIGGLSIALVITWISGVLSLVSRSFPCGPATL
jgi:hypothetical protein